MSSNPFDHFRNGILFKKPIEFNKKEMPVVLLMHYLAHKNELLPIVNKINKNFWSIPEDKVWKYFVDEIPKNIKYIKWIKKEKIKEDKKLQDKIYKLQEKYYNMSENEAKNLIRRFNL